MTVIDIIDCDVVNYKKPSMFIATSQCNFKCNKEAGCKVCQNIELINSPTITISPQKIIQRFYDNPLTEAIVIGGLEPFDDDSTTELIEYLKPETDLIIYTGYYVNEIPLDKLLKIAKHPNTIIKFGRYIPNRKTKYSDLLGVELAGDNQYTMTIKAALCVRREYFKGKEKDFIEKKIF